MPTEEKNKTIAIVTYPGVGLLDFVVTQTVLDRGIRYRMFSVGERTEPMDSDTPIAIISEKRFEEHGAELVSSVSTGAFVLAAAGLPEGRQATPYPAYAKLLKELRVNYVQSYSVEDGKVPDYGSSVEWDRHPARVGVQAERRGGGKAHRSHNRVYDPQAPFGAWTMTTSAPCPP